MEPLRKFLDSLKNTWTPFVNAINASFFTVRESFYLTMHIGSWIWRWTRLNVVGKGGPVWQRGQLLTLWFFFHVSLCLSSLIISSIKQKFKQQKSALRMRPGLELKSTVWGLANKTKCSFEKVVQEWLQMSKIAEKKKECTDGILR